MMIMGGVTDLSMPTSATTGEPSQAPDTNDGGAQDFAALLAAWFAPASAPITPETMPNAEPTGGQAASLPAITSDQQATAPSLMPLTFQTELVTTELAGEASALPAPVFSETIPLEMTAAALQQKMAAAATAASAASTPIALATPDSTTETASFDIRKYADTTELDAPTETTAISFEAGVVKLAARVVKDILGETKPTVPGQQKQEAGDFSNAESWAEPAAPESAPSAQLEANAFKLEVEMANLETAHLPVTTSPIQGTSTTNPPAQVSNNSSSPITQQTIDPLIELAQQTSHRETRSLRFHLHPEELGRVDIEVTKDAAGRVSASLNAERMDAADSLTHSIGHLREALEKAGVNVDQLNVFTTPQFQQNAHGQTAQQQPSHTPRATPAEQLLTEQSEESTTTGEEEKLLNLRA